LSAASQTIEGHLRPVNGTEVSISEANAAGVSYTSKIESKGSTIRYWREYVVNDPDVGTDKLAGLHKLENAIYEDESATAVLKKQ
jgi:hypothetical protein